MPRVLASFFKNEHTLPSELQIRSIISIPPQGCAAFR